MARKACLTLNEALQLLQENLDEEEEQQQTEDLVDIAFIPPPPDILTDEDDVDDDIIVGDIKGPPRNIPGTVELHYHGVESSDNDSGNEIDTPGPSRGSRKRKSEETLKWTKKKPMYSGKMSEATTSGAADRLEDVVQELKDLTPYQIFLHMIPDDIFQMLADQSNLYAKQQNRHNFNVTLEEMKNFIGILLFSGYHTLPRERQYWALDDDLHVEFASQCMPRNRILEIKRNLHIADNSKMNPNDRMYKLKPLFIKLQENFIKWGIFHEKLSIDEQMVRYFGHHPSNQFIRGKPIRYGFKQWALCSASGYCYNYDVYCGRSGEQDDKTPLGTKVVLNMLSVVQVPTDHTVFFDNYFTSYDLLVTLKESGYKATGTIRENRTRKCPLLSTKEAKKKDKGFCDSRFEEKNRILVMRWKDNSIVNAATNYDCIQPMKKAKRWSSRQKSHVDIPLPHMIDSYNSGMGGVDQHDQAVNAYRIKIRGKKWWWPLFTYSINMAVVNAWRLHQLASSGNLDLLAFLRIVTRTLIKTDAPHKPKRSSAGGRGHSLVPGNVPEDLRKSFFGHFPIKTPSRCRCVKCNMKSVWKSKKCNVFLCLERNCFEVFHVE